MCLTQNSFMWSLVLKLTFKFSFLNIISLLQIKTGYGPAFIYKFCQDIYFQAINTYREKTLKMILSSHLVT